VCLSLKAALSFPAWLARNSSWLAGDIPLRRWSPRLLAAAAAAAADGIQVTFESPSDRSDDGEDAVGV